MMNRPTLPIRILELYSGIGGMHCAAKESGIMYEIVAAIDINPTANKIYKHNFPKSRLLESGIEGLTVKRLDEMKIDMILMSPPCQPFTRVGKKQDSGDARTNSFLHLLDLLPRLHHSPSYVLVENVKGFEVSQTRDKLVNTLKKCDFEIQEFLLTPLQFGIPNARLRYYLIAKRKPLIFSFQTSSEVMESVPEIANTWLHYKQKTKDSVESLSGDSWSPECLVNKQKSSENINSCKHSNEEDSLGNVKDNNVENVNLNSGETKILVNTNNEKLIKCDVCQNCICLVNFGHILRHKNEDHLYPGCKSLYDFLEDQPLNYFTDYILPDKEFKRFIVMDIVIPCLKKSTCFTKRYGHFMEGAGSVIQMTKNPEDVQAASELKIETQELKSRDDWGENELSIIRNLQLRYFTPREIANLLCFPPTYSFPDDTTRIQLYRVLGNSLNVHVVSILIRLLISGDDLSVDKDSEINT